MTQTFPSPTASRPTFSTALQQLRGAQKPSTGAAAYSRYVNRPLGRVFAAYAASLGISPNAVTAVSALFSFSGIALVVLVPPTPLQSAAVALLLIVGYALDSADGQVARLRGGGTIAGEWLDHVIDALKTSCVHAAVLVSWFRFSDLAPAWSLVPLGFLIVGQLIFFGLVLSDLMRRLARGSSSMILKREGKTSALYSLAVLPFDYGLLCIVFLLLWTPVFPAVYGLLFLANALVVPLVFSRWFREMRRLGAS